ncbi:MAG: hypothetical protein ACK5KO_08280, partial [Arachnia sp.]
MIRRFPARMTPVVILLVAASLMVTVPARAEEPTPDPSPSSPPASASPTQQPEPTPSPSPTQQPAEADASDAEPAAAEPSPTTSAAPQPQIQAQAQANSTMSLTAHTAGVKQVGATTNVWGTVTPRATSVWTEVLINGSWSRSQTRTPQSNGFYAIPLTYGATTPGTYRWRVGARSATGQVSYSPQVQLLRYRLTAATAGTKPVGQLTNVWGTVAPRATSVWTEVLINGSWSRSQTRTPQSNGYYVIPLTYGATTPGTYRWRVGARTAAGQTLYSSTVTLVRAGWRATIHPTTAAEVASTYRAGCPVGPSSLSTITMTYRDYSGNIRTGVLIVRNDIATTVRDAFKQAFDGGFRIAQMRNPNAWQGDDIAMMEANNTNAFNCRQV